MDGCDAEWFQMDVTDPSSVERTVTSIAERMGPPTRLVNNAGIARQALFTDSSDEQTMQLINTDLVGAMRVTKAILPYMIRAKRGAIVNISSMWGQVGASCEVDYSAAKAGVIGFTKALAKETAPSGVRVNCVAPGCVDTAMMAGFSREDLDALCDEIPMGRIGQPSEIAEAVAFLLSDAASYITGQVLGVNGGMII